MRVAAISPKKHERMIARDWILTEGKESKKLCSPERLRFFWDCGLSRLQTLALVGYLMEADFVTNGMVTEDALEAGDTNNNDNLVIDGERCGICMDIVIDRGVLDCCQHWFCFVCIDNWATITNLCPLCQNEFELITCVPVYDTIGNNKVEDDSFSRDDEWSIEGKNNTLSFPSYYIDENAVICLDGDRCKIRSGSANIEGDSGLDTSIACDSCDIWYHAFCVGFDPEGTSDITWLCPRCVANEVPKTHIDSTESANMECDLDNANNECQTEGSFSGKLCVSVADTGETAVVVSMVEGNQLIPASSEKSLSFLEVDKDPTTESCISTYNTNSHESPREMKIISPMMKEQELELSLSHDIPCSLPSNSLVLDDFTKSAGGARSEPSSFDGNMLYNESHVGTSSSRNESDFGLHLGLSVGSLSSVDDMNKNDTKNQVTDVEQSNPEESLLKGDEVEPNAWKENTRVAGGKRRHVGDSIDQVHIEVDDIDAKPELLVEVSQKKFRAEGSQVINPKDSTDASISVKVQKSPGIAIVSRGDDLKGCLVKENVSSDIMSIVKGINRRLPEGLSGTNAHDKLSENQEGMVGLRVKKIMKRVSDKESSLVVENLRKEIREAVRNKSSECFEENLFDPKLLAAFRAAIAGPKTEPVNKLCPLTLKAKKSFLQKGKVREHLTKKIFANSNGRRKRAWDRDCEIEFWKHRCTRTTKPEKIETLKSVLDLLKKNSDSPESREGSESQPNNPILSRLYLADTSVFPRKDDIKPLSALENSANSEQNKQHNPSRKGSNPSINNNTVKSTEPNNGLSNTGVCSSEYKVNKLNVHGTFGDSSASGKVHLSSNSEGTSISSAGVSKVDTKELGTKSNAIKSDKRKWALEVLARKTAAAGGKTANENQKDDAVLKGNYPLLAQLPPDMRLVLAPSRHNKIPVSVRQTQLYRLTEHFLRNINLPVIRRSADTELAVADAVNIEKEVADRSKSKLVYLNLCSQEILHRSNNGKSHESTDTNPSVSSEVVTVRSEQNAIENSTDPAVVAALKNAGLLSDSPPSSPHENREICNNEDDLSGPDNIFELDSHPELDIYGDFEYDLEDEDYIGASVVKNENPQQDEGRSKMKLVFSTTNLKKSDIALDCMKDESSEKNEVSCIASCSPNSHSGPGRGDSIIGAEVDKASLLSETLLGEDAVEPSDAEFDELYGPDKEPLAKIFPGGDSKKLLGEGQREVLSLTEDNGSHFKEKHVSDQEMNASGSSFGHDILSNTSDISENFQRKVEKSDATAKQYDSVNNVSRKVEAYIKEHIRPLCKSGVITVEQYRWAIAKTTDKVMKYHCKAKNANFLVKEGEKVKKLAEQYVEATQQNRKN
ncbi:hypothetical protein L6164_028339 [Bauhinia variegata]|uniref:Uncharacterized protein n=1 Tax=Bauhinia variegata TaxID=167791 RepID=A0ACB9LVS3_BAUVA|nr:hypothetical protein L6164_028339 [Bauhinia variegata]